LFSLQEAFSDAVLPPGVLRLEARLFPGVLVHLKGLGGMGQERVPPLIIRRLADLRLGADLGDGLALEPLKHKHGFGLRIPWARLPG
jgi:hypothetical protein